MRVVVVSATSVIAVECVKRLAESGSHEFVLVGRSEERLVSTASDLTLRFPASKFLIMPVDFTSTNSIGALVEKVSQSAIDLVIIAQGSLTDQKKASSDLEYLKRELELNAVSVAVIAESFAGALEAQGRGTLGVIGSVAGDRGRAYNYSYGAGKALIENYTQGLQQRFGSSEVSVCLIKPGPTATPMTATHSGKMSDPNKVAKVIVAGLLAKRRVIYAPGLWRYIMLIVRLIPFSIFKKLTF
jgi:short-subunit dehydrogenase